MNFCLIELCKNLEIQQKVQQELDSVLKNDEITYETLNDLKYLEYCIDETLRKYPIVPMLNRVCTNGYKFSGTNFEIEKGTQVFIPVLGLHRDPNIYKNPLEFRPERFLNSPNGSENTNGLFYLPFGDGPRNCIGARMGKLQTKLGLAKILSKFSFELVDKNWAKREVTFDPRLIVIAPRENVMIKIKKRD
jgi:cytochrome P450 family 6